MNLAGIVGPALAGVLLPWIGAPLLISINALMFLLVAFAVLQWKPRQRDSTMLRENFIDSFISALRYAHHSPGMKVIHFRNLLFSLVISIVPALLPVIALKEMHLSASQLGLVFTPVGVGSLAGAVFALPYLRQRTSPNAITSISMVTMIAALLALFFTRQVPLLDGMRNTGGRGLGARRLRALGRRTTVNAGMGARTNEFVPNHVRTRRYRDWGTDLGVGGGKCRAQFDLYGCGSFRPCWHWFAGSVSQSTSPPKSESNQRHSTPSMIFPLTRRTTTGRSL